jgi:hypothetical protein
LFKIRSVEPFGVRHKDFGLDTNNPIRRLGAPITWAAVMLAMEVTEKIMMASFRPV